MFCKCKYITTICNISTIIIHSNYTRTAGKTNAVIPFAPLPGNRNSSVRDYQISSFRIIHSG